MSGENPAASDWEGPRGDKWCVQLEHMEAMLGDIDQTIIDSLQLDTPMRIAEIGCGGGGTAIKIAQQAVSGSEVHGFDISPSLIAAAMSRPEVATLPLSFIQADVAKYQAPSVGFDRLVSRFGVMFYDDPSAAFGKLYNWLKPGGHFVFATWAAPTLNPWMLKVREAVGQFVEIPKMDPDAAGPFRYADSDKFLALLESVGFTALACRNWSGQLPIGGGMNAARAARFALEALSDGELLDEAGPETAQAALESLTSIYAKELKNGEVWMDALVNIVTGQRPQ